jgi:hypothetical protein
MSLVGADCETGLAFVIPVDLFGKPLKPGDAHCAIQQFGDHIQWNEQPSGSSTRMLGCSMSIMVLRGTSPGRQSTAIGCRRACMSRRSAYAGGSRSSGCRTLRRTG